MATSHLTVQTRQVVRDTIVLFDPVLVDSDFENLGAFVDNLIGRDEGIYQLRINPQTVRIDKRKLTNTVYTKAGHERVYFGNDLTTLSYRGTTGHIWLPQKFFNEISRDNRFSSVWHKFKQLERFLERLKGDVMMLSHDGDVYRGAIPAFGFNLDAQDPWQIKYELTMQAYTDELAKQNLGSAIQRLSYISFMAKQAIPSLVLQQLGEVFGVDALSETVPGRAITDLIP